MAGSPKPRGAMFDGVLPLAALLSVALLVGTWATTVIASLYLVFATGMASDACHRDDEPTLPWRLYALAFAILTAIVPVMALFPWLRALAVLPLAMFAAGVVAHVFAKCRYGVVRPGLLSACGRRKHDARVGRLIEVTCLTLAAAALTSGSVSAVLFAATGWLLAAAAVYERPAPDDRNWILADRPLVDEVLAYETSIAT